MSVRYISLRREGNKLQVLREIILKTGEAVVEGWQLNPEVLSMRAGEYGMDPIDDADALWDMILNEVHVHKIQSPLLTEATLEAAREMHLADCRFERDKLDARPSPREWTAQEKKDHEAVLAALREQCPADRQFALLYREEVKASILDLKSRPTPTAPTMQERNRALIDKIREREGV
jgi:uncharacterized protein (DUF885 family)